MSPLPGLAHAALLLLDFQNDIETIQAAFADYYRTTILSEETDPNKLHDLKADLGSPFVLARGSTVMSLARAIHRDFADGLRFARIWGSGRFDGQSVERDHVLEDGDVIELHI